MDQEIFLNEIEVPGGRLINSTPGAFISSFSSYGAADITSACFIDDLDIIKSTGNIEAGLIFTPGEIEGNSSPQLICESPRRAFFNIVARYSSPKLKPGIHPAAVIGKGCTIDESACIGPLAVIGDNCHVGRDTLIESGVQIGDDVTLGEKTHVYPGVIIYSRVTVGNEVIIHGGTVIGADGYGFAETPDGLVKIPQVGHIRIGDKVEIGANCCVDRATLDETVIEDGAKIDNLVQIAHNVRVRTHARIAAQSGIAGSSTVGSWSVLAGQAGVGDHCLIGDRVVLTAQAGTAGSIADPGVYSGTPARPMKQQYRTLAYQSKLEAMWKKIKELEKRLEQYEKDGE